MESDAKPITTPEVKTWAIWQPRQAQKSKVGFYLVLTYFVFEFGRPQELIPAIKLIPFGTAVSVLILLSVLKSGKACHSRKNERSQKSQILHPLRDSASRKQ